MNLKDKANKIELQNRYSKLWAKFEILTNGLISNPENDPDNYKRGALLYYWLQQYYGYIKGEKTFSPKYTPELVKGNIVKVNFGFNIGNEFGGLHYAIVMNDSSANNGVVTVIPLRSLKPTEDCNTLKGNDVFLGNELYTLLQGKLIGLKSNYTAQLKETYKELNQAKQCVADGMGHTLPSDIIQRLTNKVNFIQQQQQLIDRTTNEIKNLKLGSVAIVNQIRTISKIRIVDPKNTLGILYGLRLDRDKMKLVKTELVKAYDI